VSSVLQFQVVKSMTSANCDRSALRWGQFAVSETCNKRDTFWSLPNGHWTR